MMRKFFILLSFVFVTLMCAVTTNCGGSSSGSRGGAYHVVGNWQTSVPISGAGSAPFVGVINSQGLALFFGDSGLGVDNFDYIGDTWELPTITGASSFSGTTSLYAAPYSLLPGGGTVQTVSMQGNVASATSITGENSRGSFTLSAYSPLTGSVTAFSGTTEGYIGNFGGGLGGFGMVFAASGSGQSMSFNGSSGMWCGVTGTFTQEGSNNVFDVTMTITGTGCPMGQAPGTVTGLGFESNSDYFDLNGLRPSTYLYADMLGSTPFVIEIYPPQP